MMKPVITKTKKETITARMAIIVLGRNATNAGTPEGRMWMAVIALAVKDSQTKSRKSECERYFGSRGFEEVCGLIGLDPDFAREIISSVGSEVVVHE